MEKRILAALRALEAEQDVRVLYAVESGSRAWGFASSDSDWDVRFLYVRRAEWYWRIVPGRDTLEAMLPDDLDLVGWDLQKALRLFRKSNPALLEWLGSPLVYLDDGQTADALRALIPRYLNRRSALYHYRNLAATNFRRYLQRDAVVPKKYFYSLRALLACRWVVAHDGPVPVPFRPLLDAELPDGPVRGAIDRLWREKQAQVEQTTRPPIPVLHAYIEQELAHWGTHAGQVPRAPTPSPTDLDRLFRDTLARVWSD